MRWPYPSLGTLRNRWHGKALIICGGGPSLNKSLPDIKELQRRGGYVLSVNKTHDHLIAEGIEPEFHTLLDPMPWVADYTQKVNPRTKYFVASSCDMTVSRNIKLMGGQVYLWHAGANFYGEIMPTPVLQAEFPSKPWQIVVGPTTVGLRAIVLGYQLGFRTFHLFGLDSSMAVNDNGEECLHAYPKPRPKDSEEGVVTLNAHTGTYKFRTNSHMSQQVLDFEDLLEQMGDYIKTGRWEMCHLIVHGDGLLPAYAANLGLHADPEMNIKYLGRASA